MAELRDLVVKVPVVANDTRVYDGHLPPVSVYGLPLGLVYNEETQLYSVEMASPQYILGPIEKVFEVVSGGRVISREPDNCRWLKPKMLRRELPDLGEDFVETEIQPEHVTLVGQSDLPTTNYEVASWTTGDSNPPSAGESLVIGSQIYQWDGTTSYFINVPSAPTLTASIDNLVSAIRTNTPYSLTAWNDDGVLHLSGAIPTPLTCSQATDAWTRSLLATATSQILPLAGKLLTIYLDELDPITVAFPTNMTPEQAVAQINSYCGDAHPDYVDVAYLRSTWTPTGTRVFLALTTATPRYSPRTPRGTHIRVDGSACAILGLEVGWTVVGDLPASYNDYQDFVLLLPKRADAAKPLEDFIPVVEENRLLRRAMAEFDANLVATNKRLGLFFDGLAWGLDCAEREADEILNTLDVDNVRAKYLQNIAANLGFDLPSLGITDAETNREVVRNLIRLYQIKSTEISYESFFRFLYYYASITERTSDASRSYPLILVTPQNEHLEKYYADFLQKDEHDDFFNQFKWFYVNVDDSDERLTERQWWLLPIVSGLRSTPLDANGQAVSCASLTTVYLADWNLHGNYGLMGLVTPCTPELSVDETVYVNAAKVGRVIRKVSATSYLMHYEDGVVYLPLSGQVTGTLGGGSAVPGQFDILHPNNQLKLQIDGRYVWEVDFDRYQSVYLTSQRQVSAEELEQALQIAAAEQQMPVEIIRSGDAVEIRGKTYGPRGQIKVMRPNAALGFTYNQTAPATPAEAVTTVSVSVGSAKVTTSSGVVVGQLTGELAIPVDATVRSIYFYLQDAEVLTSGTVVDDRTVALQQLRRVAKLAALEFLDDYQSCRLTTEDARDRYRVPTVAPTNELTDSQYRQLQTYMRYEFRNDPNYWTAAGRPTAGDPYNDDRFAERLPWAAADLTVDPGLGNSIFVRLDVVPFTPRTLSGDDAKRILYLAEFLRPVHATLDIIFQAMNTEDRIVGLPYDPAQLPTGQFPEDPEPIEGNNFGYYYDQMLPGPSFVSPWFFDWLQYQPDTSTLMFAKGTIPVGWVPGDLLVPTPYSPAGQEPQATIIDVQTAGTAWDVVIIHDPTWAWPVTGSAAKVGGGGTAAYARHVPTSALTGYAPTDARWSDQSTGPWSAYFHRPFNANPYQTPGPPVVDNPFPYSITDPSIVSGLIKAPYSTIYQINFTQPVPELDAIDVTTLPAAYDVFVPPPGSGTSEYVFYDGGTDPRSFYRIYDVDPGAGPGTRQWVRIFCNGLTMVDIALTGGKIWSFDEGYCRMYVPAPTIFGDVTPWSAGGLYPGSTGVFALPHQGAGGTPLASLVWDPATPYDQVYISSPPAAPDPTVGDPAFTFAPNRLAVWAYPRHWYREFPVQFEQLPVPAGPSYPFPVVAEPHMTASAPFGVGQPHFITLRDLVQFTPTWDISPAGGLDTPRELGAIGGPTIPGVVVGNVAPDAYLLVQSFDLTPYKSNAQHGWVQGVVEMQDSGGNWWFAYCAWRADPYPTTPPVYDNQTRVYAFDQRGNPGWMPHPVLPSSGPSPTAMAFFVRLWQANVIFGELADRLEVLGEASFVEGAAQAPLDVFHDLPDLFFCGIWPAQGAAANPLTPNGIGRGDLPLNRTFGYSGGSLDPSHTTYLGWLWDDDLGQWTWTGGGWDAVKDTDALLVLKVPKSLTPSFVNPGVPYTYDNATGIIQFVAPVGLGGVAQGDFFVDGNGSSFTIWGFDDATDRLLIRPGYLGFINTVGGGDCFETQLRVVGPPPVLVPVQNSLAHNYLGGPVAIWTHVWSSLLPIGMTPQEKCLAVPVPYCISGNQILNTFPPVIVPGPASLVDSVAYGMCFIGSP